MRSTDLSNANGGSKPTSSPSEMLLQLAALANLLADLLETPAECWSLDQIRLVLSITATLVAAMAAERLTEDSVDV